METKKAKELGRAGRSIYYKSPCPICGNERWLIKNQVGQLCRKCVNGKSLNGNGRENILYGESQNCPVCEKELTRRKSSNGKMCIDCGRKANKPTGARNHRWNGGRHVLANGYAWVLLPSDSEYLPMATKSNHGCTYKIQEHRLVMAQHVGRLLKKHEVVHHINGNKSDNRIENLELLPHQSAHVGTILLETENNKLRAELAEALRTIMSLQEQLGALRDSVAH